jgi:aldehyde:ferredoxin oxidoreductase
VGTIVPAKGSRVTREELEMLIQDYYEARGWDKDGIPKKSKLIELGLDAYLPSIESYAEVRKD